MAYAKIIRVGDKQHHYSICDMQTKNQKQSFNTNDRIIRTALKARLHELYKNDPDHKVIEELGVNHGSVRADIAVINGVIECYEIKSDRDTLLRLPGQIKGYNAVFDKVTLVVGLNHIFEAMDLIPDWWGVTVAKQNSSGSVVFSHIREAQLNEVRDSVSIARLLWREEALRILEEMNEADGYWSKPRSAIYNRLATILEVSVLADRVRETICLRGSWRSAEQPS